MTDTTTKDRLGVLRAAAIGLSRIDYNDEDMLFVIRILDAMNKALTEISQPEASPELMPDVEDPYLGAAYDNGYDRGFADGWNAAAEIAGEARLK